MDCENTRSFADDDPVADDFDRRMRAEGASMQRLRPTEDVLDEMTRRLSELERVAEGKQ